MPGVIVPWTTCILGRCGSVGRSVSVRIVKCRPSGVFQYATCVGPVATVRVAWSGPGGIFHFVTRIISTLSRIRSGVTSGVRLASGVKAPDRRKESES